MKQRKAKKIVINLLVVLIGGYFTYAFAINLIRDYHFLFCKNKTDASFISLDKNSNIVKLSYLNVYTTRTEKCDFKIDAHFARKIKDSGIQYLGIYYTDLSPCDIYIIEYKSPTIGIIILRALILLVVALTILYTIYKLLSGKYNEE